MRTVNVRKPRNYGYEDYYQPSMKDAGWNARKVLSLILAIAFIVGLWLWLDQRLLFGDAWISATYDTEDWRTNEGNLHTFGAWDLEAHIWKTEYIIKYWPHFQWNPYWYLGMPILKYYQSGFYFLNIAIMWLTGFNAAKAALMMVIFGHLLATLMTFFVCYKVSRRIWVSALASSFLLSNTFISLRSYGWEPITVVFLFLYPLGIHLFLKEPLRPFRFWLILVLGIAFVSHPLIWFSLCMFMGLYLISIAVRGNVDENLQKTHYIWQFIAIVFLSLLVGAFQFLPQITYEQATSGAHMGVSYLPFYQVPPNIISLKDFFFDAGNLKGPGPIIMIAFLLLVVFTYLHYVRGKNYSKQLHNYELITGLTLVLLCMVLFYYLEFYNVFPMNLLRSIQYHRIIPEFVITAAILVAALSNITYTKKQHALYYALLIAFVIASGLIIHSIQVRWATADSIAERPEFIYEQFEGRISMPYTDQSLSVRNSFTEQDQVYGYYEQGITNAYADELFSVSSGFHNAKLTELYLKAANVKRLYVNLEEGERDQIVIERLNETLNYVNTSNPRYNYLEVDLVNPYMAQAVSETQALEVKELEPPCRNMFQEHYCGSYREEFVSTDATEVKYLTEYVKLTEKDYSANASITMINPDHYVIRVTDASVDTAVIVKMSFDHDFRATVNGRKVPITTLGPDFMLITPKTSGNYEIHLNYKFGKIALIGFITSTITVFVLAVYFAIRAFRSWRKKSERMDGRPSGQLYFQKGDMK
jgi:hypothetical protein